MLEYNTTQVPISNLFFKRQRRKKCLFKGISGKSWQSDGYPSLHASTREGNLEGSSVESYRRGRLRQVPGRVSLYTAPTYTGLYVSNFPEYNGGTDDEQLLYNAVTCYAK